MPPSYRARHSTPPRLLVDGFCCDSPMKTPSPLKQHPLFSNAPPSNEHDPDDLFLQSPFKSSTSSAHPAFLSKPQPINADDEEGAIFLASSSSVPPFFPVSASKPLRTPVKQVHRSQSRPVLSTKPIHHLSRATSPSLHIAATDARVGAGTKRKSTAHPVTPLRPHTLTPLKVVSPKTEKDSCGSIMFDRLAPITAPRFIDRTPHSKVETEVHLRKQTASLTKLKLTDRLEANGGLGLNGGGPGGVGGDDDDESNPLFSKDSVKQSGKASSRQLLLRNAKGDDEVAEAISPGGHVIKRRARSRPVSAELLNTQKSPTAIPSPKKQMLGKPNVHRSGTGSIAFPSASKSRVRTSSASSNSSEGASPRPRRRVTGALTTSNSRNPLKLPQTNQAQTRKPLNRLESVSSATLFFGPPIPQPSTSDSLMQSKSSSIFPSFKASTPGYAGPPSNDPAWHTIQNHPPSPNSSPVGLPHQVSALPRRSLFDDDEDMFLDDPSDIPDSTLGFSVADGVPSPRPHVESKSLPTKYKPRDSGIVMSDEDDVLSRIGRPENGLLIMPQASTSLNSISSDADDGLITPGVGPDLSSGWPGSDVYVSTGDDQHDFHSDLGPDGYVDVDAFIMRTLAAPTRSNHPGAKRVPGTPVKSRTLGLSSRPWQSAVANKVGLAWEAGAGKKGKMPRKSLPAAFALPGGKLGKLTLDHATDSEDEQDSPSGRKEKYTGIGLGRPSAPGKDTLPALQRTRWLSRRSSSGAFSSGSDSLGATPTRVKGKDWHLPVPKFTTSPLRNQTKHSPARTASGSSTSTVTGANSPTKIVRLPIAERFARVPVPISSMKGTPPISEEEQPGKFERDFDEIGELGSGEFGKVIKVQFRGGGAQAYAIKKSKRFEGPRHRTRLREEVEILQHLKDRASALCEDGRHPNVLAYVDSWEEEEALYIQTELCESGNLAGFLWEYGRAFPRLDEARVWKIFADLSNGLRFIHDSGVIHLDLKPSNIFVTGEGRFKIGDFGMASLWPRPKKPDQTERGFEREGDKVYLAPEVLQGRYGKAADVFSFGVMMLETATNIVVPDQGEAWQRLRTEDFSQVDLEDSPELLDIIRSMMRTDPDLRISVQTVYDHPVVSRARAAMDRTYQAAKQNGTSIFAASPLASAPVGFLDDILGRCRGAGAMDISV
ncbi:hypothetical protein AX16_010667 [Volvariella volvacea WC 439]|nr:hypothetical protein AX16_010667 [Volvariella volvacea WC 439]